MAKPIAFYIGIYIVHHINLNKCLPLHVFGDGEHNIFV